MTVVQVVAVASAVAGVVVALWLLITKSRDRPRVLGIIATVLILLGLFCRFAFQWMVERFLGEVDDAVILTVLAADTVAGGVLIGAGMLLASAAIAVAGRLPKL
jgi:hypothetical protein